MTIVAKNSLTLTNLNEKAIDRTEISFWHGLSATKRPLGVYDCVNRDHQYGNEFNVTSGKTYTVRVIAQRTKGSLVLRGGIWYTAMTSGNAWDGLANFTLVDEASEDGLGIYERKLAVESGKTKAKLFIQIEQWLDSSDKTAWRIYDGQVFDENGQPLVTDQNNYGTLTNPMATPNGTYIWKRTIMYYTDGTSNTIWEYSGVGANGIAGKDGVGIQTTTITYSQSTDGTTAPTTGWTSSVPTLVKGQFLWTKTVWTYTDNSSETGYSVTYISKDGNNGTDGIAGKDGVGLTSTSITYVGSTSGTTVPTTGWTPSVPSVPAGQFLWTKTVWRYSDNTSETGYSVAMMGPKGDKGDTGANGVAGKDGNGIKTTTITYAQSTSGTTVPTSGWTSSVPTLIKGQYLWTKTVWTYTDNTNGTGYSVTYISKDGNNGTDGIAGKDGNGIKTTTITYVGSTSGTTVPTSGWTSTIPTVAAGSYLWTKTVWTYTDNTSETGYSVAKMGNTGATGPAGPPGSTGAPGKIVSNSEPISLFTGLTWKYSGTTDLTARDGTTILAGTEYYWNGSKWTLYEINAHNINGDNLSVTNGTFKDGKIESIWGKNGVNGTTTIESSHLQIYSSDSTTNTENTVAIDNLQGYAQVYTDRNTGRTITVQASVQGFFVSDSTGPYVRVTPNGIENSVDVSWTTIGSYAAYRRDGRVVTIRVVGAKRSTNGDIYIGTIPLKNCPAASVMGNAIAWSAGVANDKHIQINGLNQSNSGAVTILAAVATQEYTFQFTYQI